MLAMSASNSTGAQGLTQEEQILHHHAAMVKRGLEVYHANPTSRSQNDWADLFQSYLACSILNSLLSVILRFIQRQSMSFYADNCKRNPNVTIRIHPLLLSLTGTIEASETNPDINAISENDERALRSKLYTSPSAFPPLEIHFSGKNGQSLPSDQNS